MPHSMPSPGDRFQVFLPKSAFVRVAPALLACLTAFFFSCSSSQQMLGQNRIADDKIKNITVAELSQLYARGAAEPDLLILIDPRTEKAFKAAHIPGAKHLPLPQVPPNASRDPAIERHANIVVYGDNPATPTALAITKRLLAAKYQNVRFYAGGLSEWKLRGFPVEEAPKPPEEPSQKSDSPVK